MPVPAVEEAIVGCFVFDIAEIDVGLIAEHQVRTLQMQSVNPHLDCWLMTADSELGMILADWTEAAAVDSEHDEDYVKLDQWLAEAAVAATEQAVAPRNCCNC